MPVKERTGRVISDKMQKTITVLVETRVEHPRYKKTVRRRKKLYAHDEREEARVGDVVRIRETRPLSKLKRWRLVEILQRAPSELAELPPEAELEGVGETR
jgi:small subunit ribosomal protein S17